MCLGSHFGAGCGIWTRAAQRTTGLAGLPPTRLGQPRPLFSNLLSLTSLKLRFSHLPLFCVPVCVSASCTHQASSHISLGITIWSYVTFNILVTICYSPRLNLLARAFLRINHWKLLNAISIESYNWTKRANLVMGRWVERTDRGLWCLLWSLSSV